MTYIIETLRSTVTIPDLKITVTPSSPQWITEEQYKGSLVLKSLQKQGTVRVTPQERSRSVRTQEAARVSKPKKSAPAKRIPTASSNVATDQARLEGLLIKATDQAARKAAREVLNHIPAPATQDFSDAFVERVAGLLGRSEADSAPKKKPSGHVIAEEPVFIPQGIVSESTPDIIVESSSAEGGDLGESAAALKSLRKKGA